ncbi:hypothetical protein NJBCHELONAE_43400 [Mycobacteroides chelonae]|nr:hypothetical protein NJBCHELONAE_43400 [Mycobacteroides chelonae]
MTSMSVQPAPAEGAFSSVAVGSVSALGGVAGSLAGSSPLTAAVSAGLSADVAKDMAAAPIVAGQQSRIGAQGQHDVSSYVAQDGENAANLTNSTLV